jgi:hypothetical protein
LTFKVQKHQSSKFQLSKGCKGCQGVPRGAKGCQGVPATAKTSSSKFQLSTPRRQSRAYAATPSLIITLASHLPPVALHPASTKNNPLASDVICGAAGKCPAPGRTCASRPRRALWTTLTPSTTAQQVSSYSFLWLRVWPAVADIGSGGGCPPPQRLSCGNYTASSVR